MEALAGKAMRRIQNAGLIRGWGAWQGRWEEAARQKRVLAGAAARLARPQLVTCFAHWRAAAEKAAAEKAAAERAAAERAAEQARAAEEARAEEDARLAAEAKEEEKQALRRLLRQRREQARPTPLSSKMGGNIMIE